jgi:hypothetical protein
MQANPWLLLARLDDGTTRVPAVRRLLSPVNVGVSAARHVLWYLSYHAAPRQR